MDTFVNDSQLPYNIQQQQKHWKVLQNVPLVWRKSIYITIRGCHKNTEHLFPMLLHHVIMTVCDKEWLKPSIKNTFDLRFWWSWVNIGIPYREKKYFLKYLKETSFYVGILQFRVIKLVIIHCQIRKKYSPLLPSPT